MIAENIAERVDLPRQVQDECVVLSRNRAEHAWAEGRFVDQLLPVTVKRGREQVSFECDEHIRPNATLADMQKLWPVFKHDNGTVTPGNASFDQ